MEAGLVRQHGKRELLSVYMDNWAGPVPKISLTRVKIYPYIITDRASQVAGMKVKDADASYF